jgi:hypothetical protein
LLLQHFLFFLLLYRTDSEDEEAGVSTTAKGKKTTRAKRKVEGGSDVEDGEVEEVDSDAEDEVDREDEQKELLQKMQNLR